MAGDESADQSVPEWVGLLGEMDALQAEADAAWDCAFETIRAAQLRAHRDAIDAVSVPQQLDAQLFALGRRAALAVFEEGVSREW